MPMEFLRSLNIWTVAIRLFLALIISGFIGFERGRHGRAAGMRTHILVCLGAALTTMIGFFANSVLDYSNDPLRIAAQVISGIGFLGVGTILIKGRFQITGLTTAAGLWATAAIGIALGAGFYEGALIAFLICILTVTILHKLEYKLGKHQKRYGIYVEIISDTAVRETVDFLTDSFNATDIQITSPRSGKAGNVGIEANIDAGVAKLAPRELSLKIEEREAVVFAIESV